MKHFVIFFFLLSACSASAKSTKVEQPSTQPDTDAPKELPMKHSTTDLGRAVVDAFYANDLDPLYARFSNRMKKALTEEQWKASFDQVFGDLGKETAVKSETESLVSGFRIYRRKATFTNTGEKVLEVVVAFGHDDLIEGFSVAPPQVAASSNHLDYKTKTDLIVPWRGEWNIVWGGRDIEKNYHAVASDQRFAIDVLQLNSNNATHDGDASKNENYLAFSQEVIAPGDGVVVATENSVADNVPGEMNPKQAMGNHVIIDHQNGEFSVLAHFKQGTVKVAIGQELKQGELLGLCGNSGNSSEAHIHYHLQTTAIPFKGEGLPIQFKEAKIDGRVETSVELLQGQRVGPTNE